MKRMIVVGITLLALIAVHISLSPRRLREAMAAPAPSPTRDIPTFQLDPSWPKLPSKWIFAPVSGLNVDAHDNVWVITRSRGDEFKTAEMLKGRAAPPVIEFDAAGNFIQAWGGPAEGYEWLTDTATGA